MPNHNDWQRQADKKLLLLLTRQLRAAERHMQALAVDVAGVPDLAFFFGSCVAWPETEGPDTVIVVDSKRPMPEDYAKGKDPVQPLDRATRNTSRHSEAVS